MGRRSQPRTVAKATLLGRVARHLGWEPAPAEELLRDAPLKGAWRNTSPRCESAASAEHRGELERKRNEVWTDG
jgi:hypothetical protein